MLNLNKSSSLPRYIRQKCDPGKEKYTPMPHFINDNTISKVTTFQIPTNHFFLFFLLVTSTLSSNTSWLYRHHIAYFQFVFLQIFPSFLSEMQPDLSSTSKWFIPCIFWYCKGSISLRLPYIPERTQGKPNNHNYKCPSEGQATISQSASKTYWLSSLCLLMTST